MNALRAKIALLVMGACVAMSVIAVTAAASVAVAIRPAGGTVMFRYPSPAGGDAVLLPADGMAATILPSFSPDAAIAAWAAVIVLAAAAVGLVVANMVVKPLAILEDAVQSVGPEGFIPHIDERGLGETLEAARLINRLSARLHDAMESRMRLVAAAGHDLRTPMTRMRLRAEMLPDEADQRVWLSDIDEVLAIADSAIRLVREETGQAGSEEVDLDTLVLDVCAEAREIGLPVEVGATMIARVRGGHVSLKRAIANLVNNAAVHGGTARVRLDVEDATAVVRIEDDGPGIPDEALSRAFEPFFRVDPARGKKVPGAGLGLAIAREIVTRHGGEVRLSNKESGGLLQEIRFPML